MNKIIAVLFGVLSVALAHAASAHCLWINVIHSTETGHYLTSIGYGHVLPMEESLTPDWGPVVVTRYDLLSPTGQVTALGLPHPVVLEKTATSTGLTIQPVGDFGVRKISPGKDAQTGTYQVLGESKMWQIVQYRGKDGQQHFARNKATAEIPDLSAVIKSDYAIEYLKAVFAIDKWTAPAAVGQLLEIIPLSDLSALHAGDRARFKVLLNGKPAPDPFDFSGYITATNSSYGDTWGIHMGLVDGVGEMIVPAGGQWRIDAHASRPVTDFAALAQLPDKMSIVRLSASLTFEVRP